MVNVHTSTAALATEDERYARISLFTREMSYRFTRAPRYEAKEEIVPNPTIIRAIPNYLEVAVETEASLGFQHLPADCHLVAVEESDGSISGRRFLMDASDLHAGYRPLA